MSEKTMGFRFRKTISLGKGIRLNVGSKGMSSITFGKRGAPHVTVGRSGTRVGASIPGTGISYSSKIAGTTKPADTKRREQRKKDRSIRRMDKTAASPGTDVQVIDATEIPPTYHPAMMQGAQPPSEKRKGGWKPVVALALVFVLGISAGGITADPTNSTQYKELQAQLVEERKESAEIQQRLDELSGQVDSLDEQRTQIEQQQAELDKKQAELDEQKTQQEQTQKDQDKRQSDLDAREANIAQREQEKQRKQQETIQAAQQQTHPTAPQTQQNVYFKNCSEVRAAGAAPIYRGQPGYSSKLDRDGDGVACE